MELSEENKKLFQRNLELCVERTDHAADLFFWKSEAEHLKLQVKSLNREVDTLNGQVARLEARIAPSESREKSVGGRLSGFLNLTPQSCRKCSTKTAEAETQTCPSVQKEEGTQTSCVQVEAAAQTYDVQQKSVDTQTAKVEVATQSMETQTSERQDKTPEQSSVSENAESEVSMCSTEVESDEALLDPLSVPEFGDSPSPIPEIPPPRSTRFSRGSVTNSVYTASSDGSSTESTSGYSSTNTPHQMPKRKRRTDFRYRNHYYKDYYPGDSEDRYSENWRSVRRPQSRYPQDSGSESNNWRKFKVKQKEEFTSRMNAAIIQILQYVITAY